MSHATPAITDASSAAETVHALLTRARAAQKTYARYKQEQLDEVVSAVGWAIMEPTRNRTLARIAVRDTGLGDVEDTLQCAGR